MDFRQKVGYGVFGILLVASAGMIIFNPDLRPAWPIWAILVLMHIAFFWADTRKTYEPEWEICKECECPRIEGESCIVCDTKPRPG